MARKTGGNIKDLLFERTTGAFAFLVLSLAVLLFAVLLRASLPALRQVGAPCLLAGPGLGDVFITPVTKSLGWIPLFKGPVYGPSMLAAGVLLSIMIIPFILSVSREVLATIPQRQKEAVLSLGGTRWEMLRIVIGQHCIPGIFGATILGVGRAWGGTMAGTVG